MAAQVRGEMMESFRPKAAARPDRSSGGLAAMTRALGRVPARVGYHTRSAGDGSRHPPETP